MFCTIIPFSTLPSVEGKDKGDNANTVIVLTHTLSLQTWQMTIRVALDGEVTEMFLRSPILLTNYAAKNNIINHLIILTFRECCA